MWAQIKKAINSNLNKSLDILIQEKTTETNGNITSVDAKVQAGNNLIGANNNTGGSVGVGSLSARINKLLTDWTTTRAGYLDTINTNVGTLINGRVVKSVQRGVIFTENPATAELNVTHNTVDLNKSVILLEGGAGDSSSTYTLQPFISSRTANGFQIKLSNRGNDYFRQNYPTSWQIIEFY